MGRCEIIKAITLIVANLLTLPTVICELEKSRCTKGPYLFIDYRNTNEGIGSALLKYLWVMRVAILFNLANSRPSKPFGS